MKKENLKDPSGISLGLSLIIIGVVVQFVFVEYNLAIWVATFLIGFGIFGLGVEVDKVNPKAGYKDLGLGLFAIMLGVLVLNYFALLIFKILAMFILLFGAYVFINGLIETFAFENKSKNNQDETSNFNQGAKDISLKKIINSVVAIVGFLSNLSTIISNFGG